MTTESKTVSLFIPCLVDQVYPEMGMAMVHCLRHFGYTVTYNAEQTCCGQPAFNAGHREESRAVACHFLEVFQNESLIVCPSGSCTAMVRNYFPVLFAEHERSAEASALGDRVFEFSEFLQREGLLANISGRFSGKVGFHNSCHSYRELRIGDLPLALLQRISGCELAQPDGEPVCCGFGGLFSFKYAPIAATMAKTRLEQFIEKGVETLVVNDPGCIMHMRQEAQARGETLAILHLAEFLEQAMLRG